MRQQNALQMVEPNRGQLTYELDRKLPSNIEAEQALLGAILLDNQAYEKIEGFLKPEHFFELSHRKIYDAFVKLVAQGQTANQVTLKNYFEQDETLIAIGGPRYIAELSSHVISVSGVENYGKIVYENYLKRQLIEIGEVIVDEAYTHSLESSAEQQIQGAEKKLYDLATVGDFKGGLEKFNFSLTTALEMAEKAFNSQGSVTGVTTGLTDLNAKLGGLQPSDLIIVAGRPAMGKTGFSTNLAYNAARAHIETNGKEGGVVAFFSLEMSSEQLAMRILAEESRVPSDKIRKGEIKKSDFPKFAKASQILSKIPLYIDDTPGLSVAAIRSRARRLKRTHGLDMIVIDYLQLMRSDSAKGSENRVQEISEISRGLKGIAKELNIPVIALSQLSRAVETREDKKPQLSDLRESGSIEQDADVVIFLYREQYYHERSEPKRKPDEDDGKFNERYERWALHCEKIANLAEVIIAKQRHGPIGTVTLHFEGEFTKFSDYQSQSQNHHE